MNSQAIRSLIFIALAGAAAAGLPWQAVIILGIFLALSFAGWADLERGFIPIGILLMLVFGAMRQFNVIGGSGLLFFGIALLFFGFTWLWHGHKREEAYIGHEVVSTIAVIVIYVGLAMFFPKHPMFNQILKLLAVFILVGGFLRLYSMRQNSKSVIWIRWGVVVLILVIALRGFVANGGIHAAEIKLHEDPVASQTLYSNQISGTSIMLADTYWRKGVNGSADASFIIGDINTAQLKYSQLQLFDRDNNAWSFRLSCLDFEEGRVAEALSLMRNLVGRVEEVQSMLNWCDTKFGHLSSRYSGKGIGFMRSDEMVDFVYHLGETAERAGQHEAARHCYQWIIDRDAKNFVSEPNMSEGIRSFRATVKIAAKRRLSISEEKRNHSKSNKLNLLSHGDFENPVTR